MTNDAPISAEGRSRSTISTSMLVRLGRQEPEAWNRLVQLYGPIVITWARRGGLNEEDAADVAQEALATVARRIKDFCRDRAGDTFRGWLWTITRSKIQEFWRRPNQRPLAIGGTDAVLRMVNLPADQDSSLHESELAALLSRGLELIRSEFEERTRQAFLAWYDRQTTGRCGRAGIEHEPQLSLCGQEPGAARLRSEFENLSDRL